MMIGDEMSTEFIVNDFMNRTNLFDNDIEYWHDELMLLLARYEQIINNKNVNTLTEIGFILKEMKMLIPGSK